MKTLKNTSCALALISASSLALAMQALDESQLSQVTGEGLGTTFENLVIDSDDYRTYPETAFKLKLRLTEDLYQRDSNGFIIADDNEYLVLSELRLHKSRNQIEPEVGESVQDYEARVRRTGGFLGTIFDPYSQSQVVEIGPTGNRVLALQSAFPGKDIGREERGFFDYIARGWTGKRWNSSLVTGAGVIAGINDTNRDGDYRGLPQHFFESGNRAMGNFFEVADGFSQKLSDFEDRLDLVSDKFDLHLRVDAITDSNKNFHSDDQFLSYLDIIGMRFYGTYDLAWAHSSYGVATGGALGLRADEIRLTTDVEGLQSSVISAKGIDVYMPMGSLDQPHTTTLVMYDQVKRGEWKAGTRVGEALPQIRMETHALPASVGQAPQGHIVVQQLVFGDPNDKETVTGYEDIHLRDRSGTVVKTVKNVEHRAFIPKTVTYNEQVDLYNSTATGNLLPNIPNQNVIEIRGLEIQRQVVTTQDLGR